MIGDISCQLPLTDIDRRCFPTIDGEKSGSVILSSQTSRIKDRDFEE